MTNDQIVEELIEMLKTNGVEATQENLLELLVQIVGTNRNMHEQLVNSGEVIAASKTAIQALTRMLR